MLRTTVRRDFRAVSNFQPQSGFTITELLIVLTLIGILSVMSMPTLKGFAATRRLKASAYTLRSLLTFARDMAVTDRTAHLVVFDFDNERYWLASSETFDPSNPLTSALTAQNSTVVAAIQNNTQRNSGLQTDSYNRNFRSTGSFGTIQRYLGCALPDGTECNISRDSNQPQR